jgi:hypothetical protein
VVTTIRFYYDATIAVALTSVFALVVALIAAVIVGGNAPNFSVAIIAFALTGAILLFRWRRGWLRSTPTARIAFRHFVGLRRRRGHPWTHAAAARWGRICIIERR